MESTSNTSVLDRLTPRRRRGIHFNGPIFAILLGLFFAVGLPIAAWMKPARNAPAVEIFVGMGAALVFGGMLFAFHLVIKNRRMWKLIEEAFEYKEIYRNRFVTVSVLNPLLRALCWSLPLLVLGVIGIAMFMQKQDREFFLFSGTVLIAFAGVAFLLIWGNFLKLMLSHLRVITGEEPASVEGIAHWRTEGFGRNPPRYLDIAGRSFALQDCSGGGPENFPIRGVMRAWFVQGDILVRADWRRLNDSELQVWADRLHSRYLRSVGPQNKLSAEDRKGIQSFCRELETLKSGFNAQLSGESRLQREEKLQAIEMCFAFGLPDDG